MTKALLRARMKEKRRSLSASSRAEASLAASCHAADLIQHLGLSLVTLFASFPDEIDTAPLSERLLALKCVTLYPKVTPSQPLAFYPAKPSELVEHSSKIGVLREPVAATEPFPLHQIDVFFIPGLAFDKSGARLGFGGGYYDRTLPLARPGALRIGYAFAGQLIEDALPQEPHDQRVHAIVTELGVLQVSSGPFLHMAFQGARESLTHGPT